MANHLPWQIDHFRSWIGREDSASEVVSAELVHKFNATLDLSPACASAGEPAPPLIHYCLAQPSAPTRLLGEDGHPRRGDFLPPVPLPHRMWVASSLIFHSDLLVGDLIRRVSRIADVVLKEGRSGTLCFVTVEHRIEVGGASMIEETQTIVYRDATTSTAASSPKTMGSSPAGAYTRPLKISAALLFRYSALTFNAHRIPGWSCMVRCRQRSS